MKILGIGNAIVDVICKVNDDFLTLNNLMKGTMKLIFNESESGNGKFPCRNCNKTFSYKENVTRHKKSYCENADGHLGWTCPVSTFVGFETSLDLDHLDGDHHNNVPSNVKTYCKLCHGRKSILNGDCNSNKSSSRSIQ